jgi:hypothetical protein
MIIYSCRDVSVNIKFCAIHSFDNALCCLRLDLNETCR